MKQIGPLPWMEFLLRFLLPRRDREAVAADLYEEFCDRRRASRQSFVRASLWYLLQTISFAPRRFRSIFVHPRMLASLCALTVLCCCWLGVIEVRQHLARADAEAPNTFAGRWVLPFQGKPFVTFVLTPSASGYAGSATNGNLQLYSDGRILSVKAQSGISQISSTRQVGPELRINLLDGDDTLTWKMVLKDRTHADLTLIVPGFDKVQSFQAVRAA